MFKTKRQRDDQNTYVDYPSLAKRIKRHTPKEQRELLTYLTEDERTGVTDYLYEETQRSYIPEDLFSRTQENTEDVKTESYIDDTSFEKSLKLMKKAWEYSIRSRTLSDKVCTEIMENYKNGSDVIPSLLHVCANPPPCNIGEVERVTNNRKWCKGRGLKYDSLEFYSEVDRLYNVYKRTELEERKERIETSDLSTAELKEISEDADELESLRNRLSKLQKDLHKDSKDNEEDLIQYNRFKSLIHDPPAKFQKELQSRLRNGDEKRVLTNVSTALQEQKVRYEVGQSVVNAVLDRTKQIRNNIKEELVLEERENLLDTNVNTNIESSLQTMKIMIEKLDQKSTELQRKINEIDQKQEQVLELSQNINENVLRQYVNEWHQSRLGVLKKIALAPFKALDFIVFRPARYAFWYFFGRFFYLLWGIIMLLVLLVCFLSGMSAVKEYYPELMTMMYDSAIYLWGAALQSGSIAAETLKPMFGDSVILVFEGVKAGSAAGLLFLWDRLITMITAIFKTVTGQIGYGLTGWLW